MWPITFSQDDKLAALFGRDDNQIYICEIPSGKVLHRLGEKIDMNEVEFFYGGEASGTPFVSPSGARFITTSEGRTLGKPSSPTHLKLAGKRGKTTEFGLRKPGPMTSDSCGLGRAAVTWSPTWGS